MIEQKYRLRAYMLYDFKQGKTATESHRILCELFGDDVPSVRQCQRWFQRFQEGDESLEDEEHGQRPEIVDNEALKEAVESDPSQTTRELANKFGCHHATISNHLHAIGNSNRCGKWVDPATAKFLHDNARPHVAKVIQQKIEELDWEVLPHPPYSPDLAPSDYHLFRSMQHYLAEKKFKNCDEVKIWVSEFFESQPAEFFEEGIHSLRRRWRDVVNSNGEYLLD